MPDAATEASGSVAARWRTTFVASVVVFVAMLLLFRSTVEGMVYTWYNFETYTHGFIILPITIWLIWQKRAHLAAYTPQPTSAFVSLVLLSLGAWTLARLTGVLVVEQLALVGALISAVATLLGWQVAKFLAFPLLFLLFAVPMGEDLVPPMMEFTASFTVGALKLTGIPVYRDGLWFSVPSGNWSVVEACSGVRYLIASVTLGVMYAYITYHTLWKRLLFIALSAIVPIFANGLRAYMIVMIGHLSDMKYAVGVDHLIYGWIFFGFVMFILFWIGSYWQEEHDPPQFVAPPRRLSAGSVDLRVAALSVAVLTAATLTVWGVTRAESVEPQVAVPLQAPAGAGNWTLSQEPTLWTTNHLETAHEIAARYRSAAGEVQLFVALYPRQRQGAEAISDRNRIAEDFLRYAREGRHDVTLGAETVTVNRARAMLRIDGRNVEHRVWQWYRVAGHSLTNRYLGKAREALARIYPGRTDGAWIVITTPSGPLEDEAAERRLAAFASEMVPKLDAAIDRSVGTTD
ncbi:MAG: exosortase A [Gammaproteobacteria bacterium]|nr:exosortase A [Gammaproteobacteria bacterium]